MEIVVDVYLICCYKGFDVYFLIYFFDLFCEWYEWCFDWFYSVFVLICQEGMLFSIEYFCIFVLQVDYWESIGIVRWVVMKMVEVIIDGFILGQLMVFVQFC